MRLYLGIDPGSSGAVALVDETGELHELADFAADPAEPGVASYSLAADLVAGITERHAEADHTVVGAVVERVSARTGQGVTSTFKFGTSYGVALMVAAMLGPVWLQRPTPAEWKRTMELPPGEGATPAARAAARKRHARNLATDLWPSWAPSFARVKDADRAEAALMAEYARRSVISHGDGECQIGD